MKISKFVASTCLLMTVLSCALSSVSLVHGGDPNKVIVLRFDDGLQDFYTNAKPILDLYGFKATLAISTDHANSADGVAFMTWGTIQSLSAEGFEIASHSKSHPRMDHLSGSQLYAETVTSRNVIASHGIPPPITFVYPFGIGFKNATVINALKSAGYDRAMVTLWSPYLLSPDNHYQVPCYVQPSSMSYFQTAANNATAGKIVIFAFHAISNNTSSYARMNVTDFQNRMSWLASNGFTIKTMNQIHLPTNTTVPTTTVMSTATTTETVVSPTTVSTPTVKTENIQPYMVLACMAVGVVVLAARARYVPKNHASPGM